MRVIGRAPLTKEESMAKTRTKKPSVGRKSGKTKRTSKRFVKFRPMNVVTLAGGQNVGDDHGWGERAGGRPHDQPQQPPAGGKRRGPPGARAPGHRPPTQRPAP